MSSQNKYALRMMDDNIFIETINTLIYQKISYEKVNPSACFEIEAVFPPRGKYADLYIRFLKVPQWNHPAYPDCIVADELHTHIVYYGRAYCKHGWIYPGENVKEPKPIRIHAQNIFWFPGHYHNMMVTAEYNISDRRFMILEEKTPCYPIVDNLETYFDKVKFSCLYKTLCFESKWQPSEISVLDICGSGYHCGLRMTCDSSLFSKIKNACRKRNVDESVEDIYKLQMQELITWQNNVRGEVLAAPWYNNFRIKTKTEVEKKNLSRSEIKQFLLNYKLNTYRFKKRYMFCDTDGFEISLTMVKEQSGENHAQMINILKCLSSCVEKYELEVEYKGQYKGQSIDSVGEKMKNIIQFCIQNMQSESMPYGTITENTTHIIKLYNRTLLPHYTNHSDRFCMKNPYIPSVVSLTPARLSRLNTQNYTIMSKTDGFRSIGFVYQSQLFLIVENKRCIMFKIGCPVHLCFIVDGEVYHTSNEKKLQYYIFDVYAHNEVQIPVLSLQKRLQVANIIEGNQESIIIRVKNISSKLKVDPCDINGCIPNSDGFIIMYAGPLTHTSDNPIKKELVAMKWKHLDDCTIDFRVVYTIKPNVRKANVLLYTLFTSQSNVSIHQISTVGLFDYSNTMPLPRTEVCFEPQDTGFSQDENNIIYSNIELQCNSNGIICFDNEKQLVYPGEIAEMKYNVQVHQWEIIRKRNDKTTPNALGVANDNWELSHQYSFAPSKLLNHSFLSKFVEDNQETFDTPSCESFHYYKPTAYYRKVCGITQHHNVIKRDCVKWAFQQVKKPSSKINIMELGCGRGTELVTCFLPIHQLEENKNSIHVYVGIDIDVDGLLRVNDGAYWRYCNVLKKNEYNRETMFPVVFLHGDCTKDLGYPLNLSNWSALLPQKKAYTRLFGTGQPSSGTMACTMEYQLISIQFALHYMYQSITFWNNIKFLLSPGGILIATVPNGDFITDKLSQTNGAYTVSTFDEFEFCYKESSEKNTVLFSSTKIHEKEEPLFRADICKQIIHGNVPMLTCEILLFSEYIDRFEITDESQMIKCEQTASEIEYSKEGHYVVIIRREY